jgi:hypothetical protein
VYVTVVPDRCGLTRFALIQADVIGTVTVTVGVGAGAVTVSVGAGAVTVPLITGAATVPLITNVLSPYACHAFAVDPGLRAQIAIT